MLSLVECVCDISDNNFIGIFLYGSQNYQLDYAGSDIDTIMIVKEADKPKQEISTALGKGKIYTLRYFFNRLRRGDLECYEILYTKYRVVNPIFEETLADFVRVFSNHINYDRIKRSLIHKLDEHICHILWIIKNEDGSRYNKKRLYWAIRVANQYDRVSAGETFEDSLVYFGDSDHDLMKIKTIPNYLSMKDFSHIYKRLLRTVESAPRYSGEITDEEEKCLTDFYNKLIKGGD
jgi:hypothetical protein